MSFSVILTVAESGMYAIGTRFPGLVQGDKAYLEIRGAFRAGKDAFNPFFAGFLRAFSLSHKLYDQETAHGPDHGFPQARSGRCPNLRVHV